MSYASAVAAKVPFRGKGNIAKEEVGSTRKLAKMRRKIKNQSLATTPDISRKEPFPSTGHISPLFVSGANIKWITASRNRLQIFGIEK